MNKPIRIQRKRTTGFNLQAQSPDGRPVVSVCRPGKWGNPIRPKEGGVAGAVSAYRAWLKGEYRPDELAWVFRPSLEQIAAELRGKHLACFCPLDSPCHADVLLELANQPDPWPAPNLPPYEGGPLHAPTGQPPMFGVFSKPEEGGADASH
ncbi:DUF4326 domain-containing protein [Hymenobacter sp. 15J16-1T3B]|uniref:DUF4326 domain-containing protein n=1 Tax=Hymenobacter sp. 15J16-1T3B TaxID=2886941 RepID=UPI001D120CEE|nr:DUF4326 domain-containing protein [Hymenobacter sp. 15J16-1T3B]MCC3159708.1 DUF4326 domain-containing protein [Hymenobacter sp. 15J16-1T3B]